MKLRVIISETNIQVMQLEAPPVDLEQLKTKISEQAQISSNDIDCIQYIDKDFNEYVNLHDIGVMENLMTLKVIMKIAQNVEHTEPSTSTSNNLKCKG